MHTDEDVLLTDKIFRVQFISVFNDKIYFSGLDVDNNDKYNIYSINKNGENLNLEIKNAKGAIIDNKYIYYHDSNDDFTYGIFRRNIKTNETEELINKEYQCTNMTMNIIENCIYAHNLHDIIKYDLNTHQITNITSGKYEYGLNKLQYHNGYLYYYTYHDNAMIKRMDVITGIEEDILMFNDGDFWYDVLLVTCNN